MITIDKVLDFSGFNAGNTHPEDIRLTDLVLVDMYDHSRRGLEIAVILHAYDPREGTVEQIVEDTIEFNVGVGDLFALYVAELLEDGPEIQSPLSGYKTDRKSRAYRLRDFLSHHLHETEEAIDKLGDE